MSNNNKTANVWTAVATGRNVFKNQMDKSYDTKVRSLQYALGTKFPTYHSFGNDLNSMVENLCDSKRFIKECEDLQLVPTAVAQHVIFEGQKVFNKVRDFGLRITFGRQVSEFNKPLYVEV
ncbi:MAG: hypothetical protein LBG19_10900 [Prevotellaceae bacterium]|jgi:hypothetical protein|nr:hypothetical protein [Prevotellaceae bacterium]